MLRSTLRLRGAQAIKRQVKSPAISRANAAYLDEMYTRWQKGEQTHPDWAATFSNVLKSPSSLVDSHLGAAPGTASPSELMDHIKVALLVRAYEARGHLKANLDPLGLGHAGLDGKDPPELDPAYWGFTDADLDRSFTVGVSEATSGFLHAGNSFSLRELLALLEATYCGKIGWEVMHISDPEKQNWLRDRIQQTNPTPPSAERKRDLYEYLLEAQSFEEFLGKKHGSVKRFGLDGGETTIVGIKAALDRGSEMGVKGAVIGMPHRGRLNTLAHVAGKPLEAIFHDFTPAKSTESDLDQLLMDGSGDVKYHMGMSHDTILKNGKQVHISLVANPSHLEAVNPVAVGKTRAKQFFSKDDDRDHTMTILLHGDAAFAGQGIVYETMGMSDLHAYTTGGTLHVIVNNQIGFTTDPYSSRTQPYCSDLGKTIQAPIFHVNGDSPEDVARVCELAMEYRQTFKKDVVVDIVCYRRNGHNELEEASFTQPLMYRKIDSHPPVANIYGNQLVKEEVFSSAELKSLVKQREQALKNAAKAAENYSLKDSDRLETVWKGFKGPRQLAKIQETGFNLDFIRKIGKELGKVPEDFTMHPRLVKQLTDRMDSVEEGKNIDWATAELLALGSLLIEGNHVRFSGQDVERGTFSSRHAVIHDNITGETHTPLQGLSVDQGSFHIHNSSLSEFGVLGFELGYSLESPNCLVVWEAQFGDFANGAQVIFDQFLSCGEVKWLRQSGITIFLPHGYDGQGPEHSSARLERFLQMVDEDETGPKMGPDEGELEGADYAERCIQKCNMQVVYCTSPANHFHVIRRQIHREFRKPLICMISKAHLRSAANTAPIEDFGSGSNFRPVISDPDTNLVPDDQVRKVVFCSGQVYFTLDKARTDAQEGGKTVRVNNKYPDIALVRVEQLAPFPFREVAEQMKRFPNANFAWAQEEPKNMGAWSYAKPRLWTTLRGEQPERTTGRDVRDVITYVGRRAAAAPATGKGSIHQLEVASLINGVFDLE